VSDRRILVVGAGYVGLVTAVGLSELGHSVQVVEERWDRREALHAGHIPFFEAGLESAYLQGVAAGKLAVIDEVGSADQFALVMICVGTPMADDGTSDLTTLSTAIDQTYRHVANDGILVIRSTTPVGTAAGLVNISGLSSTQVLLNPEFLRQGTALEDFLRPMRVVIGRRPNASAAAVKLLRDVFEDLDAPTLEVSFEEAELIKNSANAFLALKLSFANELALLTEAYGGDIENVLNGLSYDPRIGSSYLRPSFGFGGSCLPKELQTLAAAGRNVGLTLHVTAAASMANKGTQLDFVDRIQQMVGDLDARRIALLGLSFKAGTDDVRESPAMFVATALRDRGAQVRAFDPEASKGAKSAAPWLDIRSTLEEAADDADAVVITTDWPVFKTIDWAAMKDRLRSPVVIDGRRQLNGSHLRSLGYRYSTVGTFDEAVAVES
jgi:UDPglucose 6-dehydrogenase